MNWFEKANPPGKKYQTIVIDPPWNLSSVGTTHRLKFKLSKSLPYPTMSDNDIKDFPIDEFAAEDCGIFMWVTHATLPLGLDIIKKWVFKYHCLLTWDKTLGVVIHGFNRRTEMVIYAYRGKFQIKDRGVSIPTFFREIRTVHSRKPRIFYDILLKNTPVPRIDIFARKKHYGFDAWGNEVDDSVTLDSF
jgi:N6-adenosine-specific RNA methylase IME4